MTTGDDTATRLPSSEPPLAGVIREFATHSTPASFAFSMSGETLDVGLDAGAPVGPYPHRFAFSGTIQRIEIDLHPAPDVAHRGALHEGQARGALATQ
jgi:hypothetical protein